MYKTFTDRELDVIACVVNKRASRKIASMLSIATKTVDHYIYITSQKIGCNSRDGIIDFIEKSPEYTHLVKERYSNILLGSNFRQELKKIAHIVKTKNIHCLIFYDERNNSKSENLSTAKLEKNLNQAGCNVSKKVWSKDKTYDLSTFPQIDCVIYNLSISSMNVENFKTLLKGNSKQIIFLLPENNSILNENLSGFTTLDPTKHNFLITLEILQKILPNSIDKNVTEFKKQYDLLYNPSSEKHLKNNSIIKKLFNNKFENYWRKFLSLKWILLISPICFSFVVYNINKEIKQLENKTIGNNNVYPNENLKTWPLQLPLYNNERFVERKTDNTNYINIIHDKLKNKNDKLKIMIIYGIGGIGKTQIASHYISSKLASNTYNYRMWFNAENKDILNQSYLELARTLGLTPILAAI